MQENYEVYIFEVLEARDLESILAIQVIYYLNVKVKLKIFLGLSPQRIYSPNVLFHIIFGESTQANARI